MQFRPETSRLLVELQAFSGNKLLHSSDLGVLLELATGSQRRQALDELSFLAKFVTRAYGIMQRIGKDGNGYDTLLREFNDNLTKCSDLIRDMLVSAPAEVRQRFSSDYFGLTQEGIRKYLELLHDLSWYKNWRLDHPDE